MSSHADPNARWSPLSGDYDFQFMIEELAVGAQFNLPYVHVVVNNSYLGLIRQAQRNFDMNYCVSLGFDNINSQEAAHTDIPKGYGVDHLRVVEGLGCKAIQVVEPDDIAPALIRAQHSPRAQGARDGRGLLGEDHQYRNGYRD